jgi:hypothetical protein
VTKADKDKPENELVEEADESPGASHSIRWTRRIAPRPVRGRWAAIISVVMVVIGVAVIEAVLPVSSANPAPGLHDGVAIAPVGAHSSSAFCSAGTGTAANTTVYLTNSTSKPVDGVMTAVGPASSGGAVPTVRHSVKVPAFGTAVVNPVSGLPAGSNSSSFVFAGGGVVASQVVGGPNGWSTAPCASQASPEWAFAGGSTSAGNALTLSLFNPASSDAAVNVTFVTSSGAFAPQAYQGLTIPAGQMVTENVGDFVQNAPAIAALVTAQSGTLVSTEFQQWSSGPTGGVSLRLGSPALATNWRFAQTTTTTTSGSAVNFYLANPTTSPVSAVISLNLPSVSVFPRRLVVAPLSVSVFDASGTPGVPQQVPYSVSVAASAPIVVGRSVQASTSANPPAWGSSSGTVTIAHGWLVPGPGVTNAPGTAGATIESLAVANPGTSPARVTVTVLGGKRPVAMFTVAPHEVTVLGAKQVGGLSVLSVSSTQPVNVEEDSGPSGSPGVVSSTGFPFIDH